MKYLLPLFFIIISSSYSIDEIKFHKFGRISSNKLVRLKTREKYVVLSIDDGPSKYTPAILDILKKTR